MSSEHLDVLIVGAGISGIGAGYHLQANCPNKTYAILEGRDSIGGTWDLFRYPGIRSDSDMYTMGYAFKPWTDRQSIADGSSILNYVRETASEFGIDKHIRFGHQVKAASWSSEESRWTVEIEKAETGERTSISCSFLFMCSGYYDYAEGYTPDFAGRDQFQGTVIHPQHWPEDLSYAGKRIVVIGSGATAVTLVPSMAESAAHVTMLQRSPTYIVSRPEEDQLGNRLKSFLPAKLAYGITRWKNVLLGMYMYSYCRRKPERAKEMIVNGVRDALGPDYDVDRHFKPSYKPWDQRLCLVPDGDLFRAIRRGKASVVTDQIETFTEKGLRLTSGEELEADVVVTATGLNLQLLSGLKVSVDGTEVDLSKSFTYKGMMLSDMPNFAFSIGYTNASWTLKCDLTCEYVCRLLNHMERYGYQQCCPRNDDSNLGSEPLMGFTSGYVVRSIDKFPKQGSRAPWRLYQNYALDKLTLGFGSLQDEAMEFSTVAKPAVSDPSYQ